MAVPKRKVSKTKVRSRRASDAHRSSVPLVKACPQCGDSHRSHRACPSCGYYRGRQVLTVEAD